MKLIFLEKTVFKNVFFEGAILKMYFFDNQFWKWVFWGYQVWSNWLCFGKGGELENWMLDQPVNNKDCSSIKFLLREYKKVLLSFFGLKIFKKYY